MAEIRIERLVKRFPDGTTAVEELDLLIEDGELFVMLGPSGCGKTTTLRCIGGLERQTDGDIRIGGTVVNELSPADRDIAMVFQFYALYPHLTGYDNMAFPLRAAGATREDIDQAVRRAAKMLRVEPLLARRPKHLSGGEQQRIALGRAMVRQPAAFLMDEPLTNLDPELRVDMRIEIKHLQQSLGTTMVHVTHDQVEAMSMGDRIGIMNQGRLEQVGTPLEVYERPATLFAAGFIGTPPMAFIAVELSDGSLRGPGGLTLPAPAGALHGQSLIAGVRPEAFQLVSRHADGAIDCRIRAREALGDETIYVVEFDGQRVHVRMPPTARYLETEVIGLLYEGGPPPTYDAESGRIIDGAGATAGIRATAGGEGV
jgi:sn-glycerol 3-phosphate transport system ATP-binding protein/multiple sugar transport system ATP-binding protein